MFPELVGDEKMEFLIHYCSLMIYLFITMWKYQGDSSTLGSRMHILSLSYIYIYIYMSSLKWIRAQKLSFSKIVDFFIICSVPTDRLI